MVEIGARGSGRVVTCRSGCGAREACVRLAATGAVVGGETAGAMGAESAGGDGRGVRRGDGRGGGRIEKRRDRRRRARRCECAGRRVFRCAARGRAPERAPRRPRERYRRGLPAARSLPRSRDRAPGFAGNRAVHVSRTRSVHGSARSGWPATATAIDGARAACAGISVDGASCAVIASSLESA